VEARQNASRSRSGGDEGVNTRATSNQFTLAHYVVTIEAAEDDLQWILLTTPADLVVVSYDNLEEASAISARLRGAVRRVNQNRLIWELLRTQYGMVLAKTQRVGNITEKLQIGGDGPHRFICCDLYIRDSRLSRSGTITLGFFWSERDAGPYEEDWVKNVYFAIEENNVRYLCGVFWRGKRETETLFKRLRACANGVFFQPFWTDEGHATLNKAETAAVAARFGIVTQNVNKIAVYPAYLVVLGPSGEVSRPEFWSQPSWSDELFPHGSGIQSGLGNLSVIPQLPPYNAPVWCTQDFLPLVQKRAPLEKWKKGVHQLLLWVGYSRPSRKSAKDREAWWNRQWSRW